MKILLEDPVKTNPKAIFFPGICVVGLNDHKDNHNKVLVYSNGALVNVEEFDPHIWPDWDATKQKLWRTYFVGEPKIMIKEDIARQLGRAKLAHGRGNALHGVSLFDPTPVGPVLYFTYDVNGSNLAEVTKVGFVDKKTPIKKRLEQYRHD